MKIIAVILKHHCVRCKTHYKKEQQSVVLVILNNFEKRVELCESCFQELKKDAGIITDHQKLRGGRMVDIN